MRGKGQKSLKSNYTQYNLNAFFLDVLTFDLTQNPIREDITFDAIVCDRTFLLSFRLILAPYGVRAGAKRLGSKKDMSKPIIRNDGSEAHRWCCPSLSSADGLGRLISSSPRLFMNYQMF